MNGKKTKKKDLFWITVGVLGIGVFLISILLGRFLGNYMIKSYPPKKEAQETKETSSISPELKRDYLPLTKEEKIATETLLTPEQKIEKVSIETKTIAVPFTPQIKTEESTQKKEEEKPIAPPLKNYRVQVGVFSQKENAEKIVNELKEKGYEVHLREEDKDGQLIYKIQAGVFQNKDNAENLVNKLKEEGYEVFVSEE